MPNGLNKVATTAVDEIVVQIVSQSMAQVQYVDVPNQVRITRGMHAPKKVTLLEAWLKQARQAIKEIPKTSQCIIQSTSVSPSMIHFELLKPDGSRVHVVIDRKADAMVMR